MPGSVYKDKKSSRYYIRFDLPPGPNGERRQKMVSCGPEVTEPKQAELVLAQMIADVSRQVYIDPAKTTLREYLNDWLAHSKNHLSPSTYERYRDLVRGHINPKLGHVKLDKLQPIQLQHYLTEKQRSGRLDGTGGLSAKTVKSIHALLHGALGQAVRWRMIPLNPADAVQPPRVKRKQMPTATEEDVARLLIAIAQSRYRLPILIALATGMRRSEVCGLKWCDFDSDRQYLTVCRAVVQLDRGVAEKGTKTDKPRIVPIPTMLADELKAAYARRGAGPNDWICIHARGGGLAPRSLDKHYRDLRREVGVEVTLHGLRHTQATNLILAGVPVKVVSERLGHSTVSFTQDVYAHVLPHDQQKAVEIVEDMLRPRKPTIKVVGA